MFGELKAAFREAVENFKEELHRDEIPETMDRLLRGMASEAASAKVRIEALDDEVREALERASREEREAATCRRREEMARQIGDEETARIAAEFAEKHERRRRVFEGKARALREELQLRRAELDEMLGRIREARAQGEGLQATAGRARAREAMGEAEDLFAELDRIGDRIAHTERRARAAADLDEGGPHDRSADGGTPSASDRNARAEARLQDLKRELGA